VDDVYDDDDDDDEDEDDDEDSREPRSHGYLGDIMA